MVWKDFFGCNWDEYAQKISGYTTERLCKQEIVKTRQQMAASLTIGGGIGATVVTGGFAAPVIVYGSRRLRVSHKKLELIQGELARRNIKLHKLDYKDVLIPLGANVIGAGIGIGFDEVAIQATNTIPMSLHAPSGSSAINAVAAHPGDAIHGLDSGFTEQVREMTSAVNGAGAGIIPGSGLSHQALVAHTSWVGLPDQGAAAGFYAGMLLAQGAEKSVASLIGSQCAWWLLEAMSPMEKPSIRIQCWRMTGMPLSCDHCSTTIRSGIYWHCCECDENYDSCNKCHNAGKRCSNSRHKITKRQFAYNSDFTSSQHEPRYAAWNAKGRTVTRNNLKQFSLVNCNLCAKRVFQGTVFHCDCTGGQFDLCESCYLSGKTCFNQSHALTATLCAWDCSSNPRFVSDCKRNKKGINGMTCGHCKRAITQGRYYHCCFCGDDDFDLCHGCYKSGVRCHVPTQHPLMLQMMGKGLILNSFNCPCPNRQAITAQQMQMGTCSICKERFGDAYLWHCCSCDGGQFDICSTCYRKGQGCHDSSHMMLLCATLGE